MEATISMLKNYLEKYYPLSDDDFEKVKPYFFKKEFKAKECLINENEQEENVFFIIKGVLRKFFRKDKHEVITQFYREGDFAHAAISFFTGVPSPYAIEAIEAGSCMGMRKTDLEKLLEEIPTFEKLFRGVLTDLFVKKDINEYRKARQTKWEQFLSLCNEQPELLLRVPQKYLASYLEMAPETFCRMKNVRHKTGRERARLESQNAAGG